MLAIVMLFCLLTGFVLGMIVVHLVDEKNTKEKIDALKAEAAEAKVEETKAAAVEKANEAIDNQKAKANEAIDKAANDLKGKLGL